MLFLLEQVQGEIQKFLRIGTVVRPFFRQHGREQFPPPRIRLLVLLQLLEALAQFVDHDRGVDLCKFGFWMPVAACSSSDIAFSGFLSAWYMIPRLYRESIVAGW